jgi:hypothetical protein
VVGAQEVVERAGGTVAVVQMKVVVVISHRRVHVVYIQKRAKPVKRRQVSP